MPDKLLKADRTRLIRRLGGTAALPDNAAELIDEALHGAAILGACRERERVLTIMAGALNSALLEGNSLQDMARIRKTIIAASVKHVTEEREDASNAANR